ncbi:type II toxin-antitoxin system VapB family antitoxin [Nocardia sp. NPDC051321]|uniref:type II toxin-antitoxin system VapB family antitoxin n=1 Tax=Nocardia sp. NPDC051321 TaxID=3364323 RepID=UPI0037A53893
MTRTVLDIDDDLLAQAAEILGTSKKVATVNAALADVVRRRKREQFASWVKAGGLVDESHTPSEH